VSRPSWRFREKLPRPKEGVARANAAKYSLRAMKVMWGDHERRTAASGGHVARCEGVQETTDKSSKKYLTQTYIAASERVWAAKDC